MEFVEPLSVYLFAMVIALGYARSAFALSGRRWIVIIIFTQGAAPLALGYVRSALALSGRRWIVINIFTQGAAPLALGYARSALAPSGRRCYRYPFMVMTGWKPKDGP